MDPSGGWERIAGGLRRRLSALVGRGEEVSSRELGLLLAAVAVGLLVQLGYTLAMRHFALKGDEPEYDFEGLMIAHGRFFYTRLPFGILHAGAWKAPLYPLWVGLWYAIGGHHPFLVRLVQVPVGACTIPLTWLLARRLFTARVALASAFVVACFPLAWEYTALLYPEALATPFYVLLLIVMLTRPPSRARAVGLGLLLGVAVLERPSSVFLFLGVLVAWSVMSGWRRGVGLTALCVLCAALVVTPWTIRNAIVMHGFLPISMEDGGLYGTFNAQSASDPLFPYAWRADPKPDAYLFRHPVSDIKLHSEMVQAGLDYIKAHPASVPAAFFWNGLSRLWDIRHPSRALAEVGFEGRDRTVTEIGLYMYYVLLPLALVGLWRLRRRRALVAGVLALALGASIVFTTDSGTRYRAPLEPLIAMLACVGALGARPAEPAGAAAVRALRRAPEPVA